MSFPKATRYESMQAPSSEVVERLLLVQEENGASEAPVVGLGKTVNMPSSFPFEMNE